MNKPILRWPGAKWQLAPWIVAQLPAHTQYLEPYCGSAAVFFAKDPAEHEILNDRSAQIVNLFQVLRSRPDELIALVELTPWARDEYYASYTPSGDPLEDARLFLVRCWQAHGTRLSSRSGWRHRGPSSGGKTASLWKHLPDRLLAIVDRLRDAEIENRPALEIIAEYPDALLYVDPPYEMSTRSGALYEHEMSIADHVALLSLLALHRGPVVLSGYAHPLYDEMLPTWQRIEMPSLAEHGKVSTEVLWLNPKASGTKQMNLFGSEEAS